MLFNTAKAEPKSRYLRLVLCCLLVAGCATINRQSPGPESRRLAEIFENYFEAYLELFPLFATRIGDHRYDDRLDVSIGAEHRARQQKLYRETLEQLSGIVVQSLTAKERLHHEVLIHALRRRQEAARFPGYLLPVRQLGSLPIEFPLLGSGNGSHPFKTVIDYDNFLKRIDGFEAWVDIAIANMRRHRARRRPTESRHGADITAVGSDARERSNRESFLSADQAVAGSIQHGRS